MKVYILLDDCDPTIVGVFKKRATAEAAAKKEVAHIPDEKMRKQVLDSLFEVREVEIIEGDIDG